MAKFEVLLEKLINGRVTIEAESREAVHALYYGDDWPHQEIEWDDADSTCWDDEIVEIREVKE